MRKSDRTPTTTVENATNRFPARREAMTWRRPSMLLCCVGRERVCVWELVCVRCVCVLCVWRHTVAVLHTKAWPPGAVLKQSSTHCKIPRVRINGVCRVVAAHKLW
jgi:hypothetical protein